jgi:hypothetical protein
MIARQRYRSGTRCDAHGKSQASKSTYTDSDITRIQLGAAGTRMGGFIGPQGMEVQVRVSGGGEAGMKRFDTIVHAGGMLGFPESVCLICSASSPRWESGTARSGVQPLRSRARTSVGGPMLRKTSPDRGKIREKCLRVTVSAKTHCAACPFLCALCLA